MNRDKKPGMETVKIGGLVYEVSKKSDLQGQVWRMGGTLSTKLERLCLMILPVSKLKTKHFSMRLLMEF